MDSSVGLNAPTRPETPIKPPFEVPILLYDDSEADQRISVPGIDIKSLNPWLKNLKQQTRLLFRDKPSLPAYRHPSPPIKGVSSGCR
jgi:hypothetical protein